MAIRIKSHWHKDDASRSLKEIAGAIAFNGFKVAADRMKKLQNENHICKSDNQYLDCIAEFLYFQIQLVERLIHGALDNAEREELITSLAMKFADHMDENSLEILGISNYRASFIERLNQRSNEYAETGFNDDGPSYPFYRLFGHTIQQVIGEDHSNRWVMDHVMDIDGPEVYKLFKRMVPTLFD